MTIEQKKKVVNTVPVPAGMYSGIETSMFRTGLITGRTGHLGQFRAIPAGTGRTGWYIIFFFFLSFVIYEFLLGQNGNLFALTY